MKMHRPLFPILLLAFICLSAWSFTSIHASNTGLYPDNQIPLPFAAGDVTSFVLDPFKQVIYSLSMTPGSQGFTFDNPTQNMTVSVLSAANYSTITPPTLIYPNAGSMLPTSITLINSNNLVIFLQNNSCFFRVYISPSFQLHPYPQPLCLNLNIFIYACIFGPCTASTTILDEPNSQIVFLGKQYINTTVARIRLDPSPSSHSGLMNVDAPYPFIITDPYAIIITPPFGVFGPLIPPFIPTTSPANTSYASQTRFLYLFDDSGNGLLIGNLANGSVPLSFLSFRQQYLSCALAGPSKMYLTSLNMFNNSQIFLYSCDDYFALVDANSTSVSPTQTFLYRSWDPIDPGASSSHSIGSLPAVAVVNVHQLATLCTGSHIFVSGRSTHYHSCYFISESSAYYGIQLNFLTFYKTFLETGVSIGFLSIPSTDASYAFGGNTDLAGMQYDPNGGILTIASRSLEAGSSLQRFLTSCPSGFTPTLSNVTFPCTSCNVGSYSQPYVSNINNLLCTPCEQRMTDPSTFSSYFCPPASSGPVPLPSSIKSQSTLASYVPYGFSNTIQDTSLIQKLRLDNRLNGLYAFISFALLLLTILIVTNCLGPRFKYIPKRLESIDFLYSREHSVALNAPVVRRKTTAGGLVSILTVSLAVIAFALLVVEYQRFNDIISSEFLPLPPSQLSGQVLIQISVWGANPLTCPLTLVSGSFGPDASISYAAASLPLIDANITATAPGCSVSITINNAVIDSAAPSNLIVNFPSVLSYAAWLSVSATTPSNSSRLPPRVAQSIAVPPQSTVLRGTVPSTFALTLRRTDSYDYQESQTTSSVSPLQFNAQIGSFVNAVSLSDNTGALALNLQISLDSSYLLISKLQSLTLTQYVSLFFAQMGGIYAFGRFLIRLIESIQSKFSSKRQPIERPGGSSLEMYAVREELQDRLLDPPRN